jgi:teichoic acid transport system ATP-binding protein
MASMTDGPASPDDLRAPTIVIDNVHVTYRVYASGRRISRSDLRVGRVGLRGMREIHALKGVSFVAHEGETVGVVGHNGSGKSTLFRAMAGLLPATIGKVWASDRPTLLGVNAALIAELSGEKNVRLGLLALGMTRRESIELEESVIEFAGLQEHISHSMRTYSAGMAARLRFAIATAKPHSILLLDEALAVGDKNFRATSAQRIDELRASAGTVMVVSHSMSSILEMCTRVIWIDHGLVRMDGDPAEVVAAYVGS